MRKEQKEASFPALKYRRVQISGLKRNRRGKHHDLMEGICRELDMLPPGAALEIPLASTGEIELANLRSAVHRAAGSREVGIETLADSDNFYVWKRSPSK